MPSNKYKHNSFESLNMVDGIRFPSKKAINLIYFIRGFERIHEIYRTPKQNFAFKIYQFCGKRVDVLLQWHSFFNVFYLHTSMDGWMDVCMHAYFVLKVNHMLVICRSGFSVLMGCKPNPWFIYTVICSSCLVLYSCILYYTFGIPVNC